MSRFQSIKNMLGARLSDDAGHRPEAVGRSNMHSAYFIDIDRISPDPDQPRKEFDAGEIDLLAQSLRADGQMQNIVVRYDAGADVYLIVGGERRYRAAKQAGLTGLHAVVIDPSLTPDHVLHLQLVENALRVDLSPIETAAAYRRLMQLWGCTQVELAARLNISQSKVSRSLAVDSLPAEVLTAITTGTVAPMAAVRKASRKAGRRRAARPSSIRIDTDAGTAVVTVKPGHSVDDVLASAREQERRRGAA
jgi:ParB family chromosome partitioning protein